MHYTIVEEKLLVDNIENWEFSEGRLSYSKNDTRFLIDNTLKQGLFNLINIKIASDGRLVFIPLFKRLALKKLALKKINQIVNNVVKEIVNNITNNNVEYHVNTQNKVSVTKKMECNCNDKSVTVSINIKKDDFKMAVQREKERIRCILNNKKEKYITRGER